MAEAKIILLRDERLTKEDEAKLQALYSRSDASVLTHIDRVAEEGSTKFLNQYYLNYGHSSIADCADAVVFVEGVSHLAAKAIQDSPLYAGQEVSTRYVDFASRPMAGPRSAARDEILGEWMRIYKIVYDAVSVRLLGEMSAGGTPDKVLRNAVHAKACDTARGYLPLASSTNLSWKTSLRQFGERLALLAHHPLAEVRSVAAGILDQMLEFAPGSFRREDYPERSAFHAATAFALHYARSDESRTLGGPDPRVTGRLRSRATRDEAYFAALDPDLYAGRPERTNLPRPLASAGHFTFEFAIDYGSYRDVQRHRNGVCRIPFVSGPLDIHAWYLAGLPDGCRYEVTEAVAAQGRRIAAAQASGEFDDAEGQYLYPLGQLVDVRTDYDLAQAVYVAEMRSSRHVHATLRPVGIDIGEAVIATFPELPVHIDRTDLAAFNLARGKQTLEMR